MKLAIITALGVLCAIHPVSGQSMALTNAPSVRGVVQMFIDEEQLTPEQKQHVEAALSGVVQEPDIAPALSELSAMRIRIQEGRRQNSGAVDEELRNEYRKLQREIESKVRTALLAVDPDLAELFKGTKVSARFPRCLRPRRLPLHPGRRTPAPESALSTCPRCVPSP